MSQAQYMTEREEFDQSPKERREELLVRYNAAADVTRLGSLLRCPWCSAEFKKKTSRHKFCKLECKDRFWNIVNPRGYDVARREALDDSYRGEED